MSPIPNAMSKLITFAVLALASGQVVAEAPGWVFDFDNARQSAAAQEKRLMIVFTGRGWCYPCELLDREVLQKTEFIQPASARYVLVELDSAVSEGPDKEQREAKRRELMDGYLVPAVPTVVLADANGRPFGYITGYDSGTGPIAYLELIASAERAARLRDDRLAAAQQTTGEARARLLDEALEAMSATLGEFKERGGDPLLTFYGDLVEEVLDLTNEQGPLAEKYISRRQRSSELLGDEAVMNKTDEFDAVKDYAGAIAYLDARLAERPHESLRWRLEISRHIHLEWSGKYEEALSNCRRLLAHESLPAEYRESLLQRESFNLFRVERVDEGVAQLDRRIAEVADDRERLVAILSWKTQLLFGTEPVERSIAAWEALRQATNHGSDSWVEATGLLARELRRAGRYPEAMLLVEEWLAVDRDISALFDAAECCLGTGDLAASRKYLDEAWAANQTLAESVRQEDRDAAERIRQQLQKLEARLAE
jgi:thioredoxin-related protein